MTVTEQSELFTIGEAVAVLQQMFPDVTHSSLRFLQREGLVHPVRTPGGHRLFRTSDLERVRRIKEWQGERLSLAEIRQRLEHLESLPSPRKLAQRFLDLILLGHGASAIHEVLLADSLGMPLEVIYEQVLRPVLYEVGSRWHRGDLSVAQEHEITELVRDVITELTLRHTQERPDPLAVVAACVADEQHDIGLRMVTSMLRSRGVQVHFLGANVSPEFLVDMVRLRRPDVVLLSATLDTHQEALRASVNALHALTHETTFRIMVGGQGNLQAGAFADGEVAVVSDESLMAIVHEIAHAPVA
jgi:methanogenic corrinoid protein MtbC1